MERCKTCQGPIVGNVNEGCTPHTCTTPCATCGHIGDVHRDWYAPGFCRKCPENKPVHQHDYKAARRMAASL